MMRNYFPKRPSGAQLHTLSKLYDVAVAYVPLVSFEAVYCFICGRRRVAGLDIGWFFLFFRTRKINRWNKNKKKNNLNHWQYVNGSVNCTLLIIWIGWITGTPAARPWPNNHYSHFLSYMFITHRLWIQLIWR